MLNKKIAFLNQNKQGSQGQFSVYHGPKQFFNHDNLEDIETFDPDIIFIQKGNGFNLKILQTFFKDRKTVHWYGDYRKPFEEFTEQLIQMCDLNLFTWREPSVFEEIKRKYNKDILFVTQGMNPEMFYPMKDIEKIYDVSFAGNYYGRDFGESHVRIEMIEYLRGHDINLCVAGQGYPKDFDTIGRKGYDKLNKIYNQSKVTIGLSNADFKSRGVEYATSDRLWHCMAVGVPHINYRCLKIEELFDDGYLQADSFEEMKDMILALLDDPQERDRIGRIQREQILKYNTHEKAWQRIENIIINFFYNEH